MVLHVPVLRGRVIELLAPKPGSTIADCTIGEGGHAEAILEKIIPGGRLIGVDKDQEALDAAAERLKKYGNLVSLIKEDYKNLDKVLSKLGVDRLDGIIFDLGLSSLQLGGPHRGFSFKVDAPLDMRMDTSGERSARDLVNKLAVDELDRIIEEYGEERFHRRIAKAIAQARKIKPIDTTRQLSEIILKALPYRGARIHPATRTFQALRIAVNDELASLEEILRKLPDILEKGGRACIISYHSLEDRRVKNCFRDYAKSGLMKVITKKPITPDIEEVRSNPRSRSAKLRAAERC